MSAPALSAQLKVLLVEDNLADARLLRESMAEGGAWPGQLVHVERLADALERLAREPFDIVLLDLTLPDAEGLETIVRTHERAPSVPIVVLTGLDDEALALRAMREGAQDYLVKGRDGNHLLVRSMRHAVERKRAEEALRQANETLRAVIATSPLAIYTLDRRRMVRSWNPAAERIFGWRAEEVIGRPLPTIPEEAEERTRAQFDRILRGEEMLTGFEDCRQKKDGGLFDVSIWTAALRDARGEINGIMAAVADNTERKRLEEQLRLAQRMEAVGRLAGGVAHDFNNLLTIITGYSDLLLDRMPREEPLRRNAEEIKKAAGRAGSLTAQLLAFSRKQVLQPKVLDLNEVVSEMDKMLRRLIGEDIRFEACLAGNGGHVKADPGQLEQVIVNLVVNAREAMPQGGHLMIETKAVFLDEDYARRHVGVAPGPYLLLAVSDTGHGMEPAIQPHIFEPFFTTKRAQKGTGLGLATVYGIVKQSGGHIWVYSEPGRGSTFKIYLPRVDAPLEARDGAAAPAEPARAEETILVAEDEDTVRGLVREILQAKGYRVLEARHGGEALDLAANFSGRIHLLVTDVVMPHMSGRELGERILRERPGVRVLYMSGYTDNAVIPHGFLGQGARFLQKPFTQEALARKVREVLDAGE